jgi:hypothetical protein
MKNLTLRILPAIIFSSIISLGICYIFLYRWNQDGFSESEILISIFYTLPIFFLVCIIINIIFLRKYYKEAIFEEVYIANNWIVVWLFIAVTTMFTSFFFDYIYGLIDSQIFSVYTAKLANTLESDGDDTSIQELKDATFFTQTIFQNLIGVFLASLISVLATKKYGMRNGKI